MPLQLLSSSKSIFSLTLSFLIAILYPSYKFYCNLLFYSSLPEKEEVVAKISQVEKILCPNHYNVYVLSCGQADGEWMLDGLVGESGDESKKKLEEFQTLLLSG